MNPAWEAFFAPHAGSERDFLCFAGGGRLSYGAFIDQSGRVARALDGLGAQPGDRVAVQVEKCAEMLVLYAACVRAGLVFLPLNPAYPPAEVAYFVGDAEPAVLVCGSDRVAALAEVAGGAEVVTLDADGTGTLMDLAEGQPPEFAPVSREQDDLAATLYTSGTTGRSKGAMLSHANLISNAEALTDLWRFTSDDTLIHALPIFHTHGLFVATNVTLTAGSAMIFLPRFDAGEVLAQMSQATALMGVPTFYTRLLQQDGLGDTAAGMRLFVSGSAPLLAETHRAFHAATGHMILERYGMTETNMTTSNPYDGERRPGTVGLPLPGVEVRLADVADGIGALEVRGPNVFQGYWRMPEKTAEELGADGWFTTGDLATISEDGYVTIVGRGKDLIISGGLNIYPKEVEDVIDALPGVTESAVIGVPHGDMGEAAVAVIVGEVAEAEVLAALDGKLAKFKHPRRVICVDALPRNAMGKVQKADMRASYGSLFSEG